MTNKNMYNEVNQKADAVFTQKSDWKKVLSLYGCQDFTLPQVLFSWKRWDLIKALENISYAAGQLANVRKEKNQKGKFVYPVEKIKAARELALTALDVLLERDPHNTKGLHNRAYIYYNTVITSNNKIVQLYEEMGIDRLQDFEAAKAAYETILQIHDQDIKANYRLARLYMTAEKSTGRFLKDYLKKKYQIPACTFRRRLIARFEKVLAIYEALTGEKAKKDFRSEWLKTLYDLGVLYTKQTFIFFPQNPGLTLETYLLDRKEGQPVPPYYQCGDDSLLDKAIHYLILIQQQYKISTKTKLHMQDYLCKAGDMHRKYPVSPKNIWYRLGEAFAYRYKMCSFYKQETVQTQSAFMNAIFFYYLALQWAVYTRKTGNNRNEGYDYIVKAMMDILHLYGIDSIMDDRLKPVRERTTDPILIR